MFVSSVLSRLNNGTFGSASNAASFAAGEQYCMYLAVRSRRRKTRVRSTRDQVGSFCPDHGLRIDGYDVRHLLRVPQYNDRDEGRGGILRITRGVVQSHPVQIAGRAYTGTNFYIYVYNLLNIIFL